MSPSQPDAGDKKGSAMKPVWSMTKCPEAGDLVLISEVSEEWYGHPLYAIEPGDNRYCMQAIWDSHPVFEILQVSHTGKVPRYHVATPFGPWIHFTSDDVRHTYTGQSTHVPPGDLIILEPVDDDLALLDSYCLKRNYILLGHND
jgi:hypothetical protein